MGEHIVEHCISEGCGFPEEKRISFNFEECNDIKHIGVDDISLKFTGTIIHVNIKFKAVCPGRKLAFAIILNEREGADFITRSLRVSEVDVPDIEDCKLVDLLVEGISFYLQNLNPCISRSFAITVIAHYIDYIPVSPHDLTKYH
ncbi:MAG TPA: hypothetical protein GX526_05840 [Thermoanaerobacterales bacterium]|nr:hypothetical protein [Thermoanaerobacterales bacterium]